jgi:membrane-bound ClpP family serine protease
MESSLFWAVGCLIAGLLLLVAELFIPSGGVIGLLSAGLLGWSLWQAFAHSTGAGAVFLVILAVLVPLTVAFMLRIWPDTPMGRWLFLKPPEPDDVGHNGLGHDRLEYLMGQIGRTLTPLRPSGLVDFEGRSLDALAEEGLIPRGTMVEAVQMRGSQVVVRPARVPDDLDQLGEL